MCGIIGYIGPKNAVPFLIKGLKRLEYRGYDSAGLAIINKNNLIIDKVKGKVKNLSKKAKKYSSDIGIAHTRWATNGIPNKKNAHPHTDCKNNIAVVHNGIIENYRTLRKYLEKKGHNFKTQTDTEVLAHLFEENYNDNIVEAIRKSLLAVEGTYGIAVLCKDEPDKIIVARKSSPLIIGKADNQFWVASDAAALINHTKDMIFLEDNELAIISREDVKIHDINNNNNKEVLTKKVEMNLEKIEKAGYEHFMLKEINEQDKTIFNAIRGRIDSKGNIVLGGLIDYIDTLKNAKRIILVACGTSWHSGIVGEYLIENIANIPVEVEYASEFRYKDPILEPGTVVFVISQSGETADTLAALREAKSKNVPVFGICNVVGSTIARETDAGVYIHAGPEIGVASTKAFTSQVMVLALISILIAQKNNGKSKKLIDEIKILPGKVKQILTNNNIKDIKKYFEDVNNALFLGRNINYPVALEGALKLKEISYIHAEGYPAAEMKHGPIALIDKNMPCVVVATDDKLYSKVISNIEEIKARNGKVIAIATKGNEIIKDLVDDVIYVPKTLPLLSPILNTIPLQLLSYYVAVDRGCDVDKPRNLAKSVTVE